MEKAKCPLLSPHVSPPSLSLSIGGGGGGASDKASAVRVTATVEHHSGFDSNSGE
jgi:hypothetical protein